MLNRVVLALISAVPANIKDKLEHAEELSLDTQFAQSIILLDQVLWASPADEPCKQAHFFLGLNFLALGSRPHGCDWSGQYRGYPR